MNEKKTIDISFKKIYPFKRVKNINGLKTFDAAIIRLNVKKIDTPYIRNICYQ